MKKLLCIFLLSFVGCISPTPHDLTQEIERVKEVTISDLAVHADKLSVHYEKYAQSESIIWPPRYSNPDLENPDSYGNGGDSAIFSGYMLATTMYKYCADKTDKRIEEVGKHVRALHILTHIAGPGVIARCAFPYAEKEKWRYPDENPWARRIVGGFVGESSDVIYDPWNNKRPGSKSVVYVKYPKMVYYTRATKDQLTGILFGLSVTWAELKNVDTKHLEHAKVIKKIISEIVDSIYHHLKKHDFKIRDAKGNNDTSADNVSGTLETQFYALYKETVHPDRQARIQKKYEDSFSGTFVLESAFGFINIFNNFDQYYAWNLRYARTYSIWLLETAESRKGIVRDYVKNNLWIYTFDQKCPFFTYIYAQMAQSGLFPDKELKEATFSLKSLSLKPIRQFSSPLAGDIRAPSLLKVVFGSIGSHVVLPHLMKPTDYFTWSKKPWDVGGSSTSDAKPIKSGTGLSFSLPYWMGLHNNFIND